MLGFHSNTFSASGSDFGDWISPEDGRSRNIPRKREIPRVLVVDDEELIADTLTEILKRNGFNAMGTYSGKQALQIARRFPPDYLLADVLMPFMNGVELAIQIREMSAKTRILLFSGHSNSADLLDEARMTGHDFDVVAKPIHPDRLLHILRDKR